MSELICVGVCDTDASPCPACGAHGYLPSKAPCTTCGRILPIVGTIHDNGEVRTYEGYFQIGRAHV